MPQQDSQLNSSRRTKNPNDPDNGHKIHLTPGEEDPGLWFKVLWFFKLVPRWFLEAVLDVLIDTTVACQELEDRNKLLESRNKDLEDEIRKLQDELNKIKN